MPRLRDSAKTTTIVFIAIAAGCVILPVAYLFLLLGLVYINSWPTQESMVHSGYVQIPQAREIDELFGPALHSCSNYEEPDAAQWFTETYFGGRYELVMQVDVRIDRQSGEVAEVRGEPQFSLGEIYRIEGRGASYGNWHQFGAEEWEAVVEADGDFSVLGIQIDLENPVDGFEEYKAIPRGGIRMRDPDLLPDETGLQ